jgi:hypothetical protein
LAQLFSHYISKFLARAYTRTFIPNPYHDYIYAHLEKNRLCIFPNSGLQKGIAERSLALSVIDPFVAFCNFLLFIFYVLFQRFYSIKHHPTFLATRDIRRHIPKISPTPYFKRLDASSLYQSASGSGAVALSHVCQNIRG